MGQDTGYSVYTIRVNLDAEQNVLEDDLIYRVVAGSENRALGNFEQYARDIWGNKFRSMTVVDVEAIDVMAIDIIWEANHE